MPSRRDLLRAGGAAGLAALAGCSRLPLVPGPQLSLMLRNEIEQEAEVSVELLRPDGNEYSEAVVYEESISVPGPADVTGAPGRKTTTDIAPARSYLVRVRFGDSYGMPAAEYRYYPDCARKLRPADERPEEFEPRLFIELVADEDGAGTAIINQTQCSGDSIWY
ncbi:hypothetical protein DP107_00735 [Haloglomus irregulare]|uniref:Tat (Twin-arginine translocation) pathway signal sequence n=1 Tax=Haloglomus irregulare TaxID=2234134 RepID=A0A554NEA9_9EURY|nr:twin-arginine translocation signal domain-containing protein [Haloglomus irregulare]TSD15741.1 hypothetical protein DP107_00735 [Haloglomus irregulare]